MYKCSFWWRRQEPSSFVYQDRSVLFLISFSFKRHQRVSHYARSLSAPLVGHAATFTRSDSPKWCCCDPFFACVHPQINPSIFHPLEQPARDSNPPLCHTPILAALL